MAEKILIIEDEPFLRRIVSDQLKENGYLVEEALDGEEGLKKIQERKFDLILLDLLLPGMDGFEVLDRLKKEGMLSKIPVLILSNLGQKEEVEKGLALGAKDYLIKAHVTPEEIVAKIKEILKK